MVNNAENRKTEMREERQKSKGKICTELLKGWLFIGSLVAFLNRYKTCSDRLERHQTALNLFGQIQFELNLF